MSRIRVDSIVGKDPNNAPGFTTGFTSAGVSTFTGNLNATGVSTFTGNLNATGVSTFTDLNAGQFNVGSGSFVVDSDGDISTNVRGHGYIELDSTGTFSDPPVKLYSNTGAAEFDNPSGDTTLSIGDKTNSNGRLILTAKSSTLEIHSRSNHPIEFLFNTVTKASVGTDGTFSDSLGPLRRVKVDQASTSFTLTAAYAGQLIRQSGSGVTITIPQNVFTAGDMVSIWNAHTGSMTIAQGTGATVYNSADGNTGNRTLAARGMVTFVCTATNEFVISGTGLS